MKIYLAGPDVFLPDRIEIGRRKTAICARYGLTGLYPLDHPVDLAADPISRPRRGCRHRLRTRLHGGSKETLSRLLQRPRRLYRPRAAPHGRETRRRPTG